MVKKYRPRGTGGMYYDDDRDRWIGVATVAGRRRKVSAITKTDCSAKLSKLLAAKATGTLVADRSYTVAKAVETFLERDVPNRRRNGRPLSDASIIGYRWAGDIITKRLGSVRLVNLTTEDVEDMFDALARRKGRPMSAASLRRIRTTLHQVIAAAVKRQKISRNVAADVAIPDAARPTKKRRALQPDQARHLLARLREQPNGLMFALSLRLGLRPGEASALTWTDVDGNVLHVHGTKTAGSDRSIELPPDVAAWVEEHRHGVARIGKALMFPTPNGRRIDASNARRQLAAACDRAGVPVLTPNELRHSCASLLSDIGVPNEAIADLLGHTTTRMVEQTYRHRLRPVVDVAAVNDWVRQSS